MPRVKKRNSTPSNKIKVKFDVDLLNTLIKYVRCEYVGQTALSQLRKFIKYLDIDSYEYEEAIYPRLKTLDMNCLDAPAPQAWNSLFTFSFLSLENKLSRLIKMLRVRIGFDLNKSLVK